MPRFIITPDELEKLEEGDPIKVGVYGYPDQVRQKEQVTYEVYEQKMDDKDFDLKRVIAAVNGFIT